MIRPVLTEIVLFLAPFAAYATKHIPDKVLMIMVGTVVVLLSLRTLLHAIG